MSHEYGPVEDPRRVAEQRFEQLKSAMDAEISPIAAHIVLDRVEECVTDFRDGEITAEDFCSKAIKIYFANRNFIGGVSARHNLSTLGHSVGAVANVDSESLARMWEHSLSRPPICY
jgi:hypothetical protein